MSQNQTHELLTLYSLDEIERAQSQICTQIEDLGFSSRDVFCVRLALDESLTNAIRHGNRLDPAKQVKLAYRVDSDEIWIEVEDQGEGFSLADIPDPREPEYLERPGGRGLFVIHSFMCSVEYNERGNRVTMSKRRSTEPVQETAGS